MEDIWHSFADILNGLVKIDIKNLLYNEVKVILDENSTL